LVSDVNQDLQWCRSLPGHSFDAAVAITTLIGEARIELADLDRDRRPDLLIRERDSSVDPSVDPYARQLRILRNTPSGFIPVGQPTKLPDDHEVPEYHETVAIGHDLDADGLVDVVVWAYDGLSVMKNISR
jgi:hypothetical protein